MTTWVGKQSLGSELSPSRSCLMGRERSPSLPCCSPAGLSAWAERRSCGHFPQGHSSVPSAQMLMWPQVPHQVQESPAGQPVPSSPPQASLSSSALTPFCMWLLGEQGLAEPAGPPNCVAQGPPSRSVLKELGLESCETELLPLTAPQPPPPPCSSGGQIRLWASQTLGGLVWVGHQNRTLYPTPVGPLAKASPFSEKV